MKKLSGFIALTALALLPSLLFSGQTVEETYSRALMLKGDKKFAEAAELLETIQGHPEPFRVYFQIADCWLNAAEADKSVAAEKSPLVDKAITFARKSIELKDDFSEAYVVLYNAENKKKLYAESADTIFMLTRLNPSNPEYLYTLGLLHYSQLNNPAMARYGLMGVVNISYEASIPSQYMERVYLILGDINNELRNYGEAVDNLIAACEINRAQRSRLFRLAGSLASTGKVPESVKAYEYLLSSSDDEQRRSGVNTRINAYLGAVYYAMESPKAASTLRQALTGRPEKGSELERTLLWELAGRDEEALAVADSIPEKERSYQAHIARGRILERAGRTAEASAAYDEAGKILFQTNLYSVSARINLRAGFLGKSPEAFRRAAEAFDKMEMPGNAIITLRRANAIEYSVEAAILSAFLYARINQRGFFEKTMAEAALKDPTYARLYFISALARYDMKEYDAALKDITKASDLTPDDPFFRYHRAQLLERKGDLAGSIAQIEKALELDPENATYQNFLGYLLADSNRDLDRSETLIRAALSKEPHNGAFLDSLGWVLFRKGDFTEAYRQTHRAMQNLIAVKGEDAVVYDHLGDISLALKRRDRAIRYWEHSLTMKDDRTIRSKIDAAKKRND